MEFPFIAQFSIVRLMRLSAFAALPKPHLTHGSIVLAQLGACGASCIEITGYRDVKSTDPCEVPAYEKGRPDVRTALIYHAEPR
jgi:hypothetical protein